MGNLLRRGAPALALTGTAVALVALFDPGVHALTGSDSASGAAAKKISATDGTTKSSGSSKSSGSTSKSTPSSKATPTPSESQSTDSGSGDCSSAKEYTGSVVNTRWGPVQVKASIASDGTVCSSDAIQYPDGDGRSYQISQYSVPKLNAQAVDGNGDIQGISGASYTSYGYQQSLQSILAKAR